MKIISVTTRRSPKSAESAPPTKLGSDLRQKFLLTLFIYNYKMSHLAHKLALETIHVGFEILKMIVNEIFGHDKG